MSRFSAIFFSYVQGATFYRALHRKAVELMPPGCGQTWFDVGCGPGLVARLAAAHGYQASGFDIDQAMITRATHNSRQEKSSVCHEVAGIEALSLGGRKASVVSAASLLAVLDDKGRALHQLLSCLNDGGVLLLIETTNRMMPSAALAWLKQNGLRNRNWILLLWAWTRRSGTSVNPNDMCIQGYRIECVDIFEGMVAAWLIRTS